jgi:hypothetical protein
MREERLRQGGVSVAQQLVEPAKRVEPRHVDLHDPGTTDRRRGEEGEGVHDAALSWSVHDVIAGIDIGQGARQMATGVADEERRRASDVVDVHELAQG